MRRKLVHWWYNCYNLFWEISSIFKGLIRIYGKLIVASRAVLCDKVMSEVFPRCFSFSVVFIVMYIFWPKVAQFFVKFSSFCMVFKFFHCIPDQIRVWIYTYSESSLQMLQYSFSCFYFSKVYGPHFLVFLGSATGCSSGPGGKGLNCKINSKIFSGSLL